MKIGDRVITNYKCDYPNEEGIVIDASKTGVCGVIQLDSGMKLLTMDYAVQQLNKSLN